MPDLTHTALQSAWSVVGALVFVALAAVTFAKLRDERTRVVRIAVAFAISVAAAVVVRSIAENGATAPWRVVCLVATFAAGVCTIRLAATVFVRLVLPRFGLTPARILVQVVTFAAVLGLALVLLRDAGVDPTSLFATSALLTAVVGLALQETLGNVLGGLALRMDRSVDVGDWVQIDGTAGRVVEVTWRYTSVETNNWETMVVPNGYLVKNRFAVLGRYAGGPVQHRRTLPFFVDVEHRPDYVIDAVERSLRRLDLDGVAADPAPECYLVELAESPVRYAVSYWLTNLGSPNPTDSTVRVQTHLALARAGIEVAVPARELRLDGVSAHERALRDREETDRRVAALRAVPLFDLLDEDEVAALAASLKPAAYLRGDTLVRQGGESRRLYVVVRGTADVFVESAGSGRARVSELGPGDFFGEIGVMTGEPRTATVVATTDMHTYRLDRSGFGRLLAGRPDLADHFAEVLATRRAALDVARDGLDAAALARRADGRRALRSAIREFFGLADARSAP